MKGEKILFTKCEEITRKDLFVAVDFGVYQRYVNIFLEQIKKRCGLRNYSSEVLKDKYYILSAADMVACDVIRCKKSLDEIFKDGLNSLFLVKGDELEDFLGPMGENYVIVEEKYYIDTISKEKFYNECSINREGAYSNVILEMTKAKTEIMKDTISFLVKSGRFSLCEARNLYRKSDDQLCELKLSIEKQTTEEYLEIIKSEAILRSVFGDNYDYLLSEECAKLISIVKTDNLSPYFKYRV